MNNEKIKAAKIAMDGVHEALSACVYSKIKDDISKYIQQPNYSKLYQTVIREVLFGNDKNDELNNDIHRLITTVLDKVNKKASDENSDELINESFEKIKSLLETFDYDIEKFDKLMNEYISKLLDECRDDLQLKERIFYEDDDIKYMIKGNQKIVVIKNDDIDVQINSEDKQEQAQDKSNLSIDDFFEIFEKLNETLENKNTEINNPYKNNWFYANESFLTDIF
jgi:hypothetical protein